MSEQIEDFIARNRKEFDALEPEFGSWEQIRTRIRKPESKGMLVWKVAASLILLTTISLIFYKTLTSSGAEPIADQEFVHEEMQFIQAIHDQKKTLNDLGIREKNQDLILEEEALEREYLYLKSLYQENPKDDRVRESLIQNLRMRGQILMEQIEVLKSLNPQKNDQIPTDS